MHTTKTIINTKLIVGALTIFLLLLSLTKSGDARVHVQVINQLESGRRLSVHCRSREDDLRHRILEVGDAVEWSFNVNIFRTTLFYCEVQWDNDLHWYRFDAYNAKRDYRRCISSCRWMIDKEGLLYGYDEELGFWKMFPLKPS